MFDANADSYEKYSDSISFLAAVKKIENFHKVRFAFDHQMLSNLKVRQTNFEEPLENILPGIIDSKKYNFEISDHTILVIPIRLLVKKNVSLSGYVIDEDTGEALPNAAVYLKNLGKYTVTNRDGYFNFLNIPTDTSLLEISYLGYLTQKFKPNQFLDLKDVKVNLSNRAELLDEITVSEIRQKVFDINLEPSKLSIRMDDMKTLSSLGEPDVFRSLQLLPGISGTNETSSGLSIRGGSPEQNLVLFDGFTVYHLDHFFGMFSAINSNVIKDVQIYKSGFGAEYGTRISGVMDITGKTGNTIKPSGNVSINFISANAVLEVPIGKKVSLLVAARRSYTDVIQSSLYNKLFNHIKNNSPNALSQTGENGAAAIDSEFFFYDLNSKFTYIIDEKSLLSFSLYQGNDNLFLTDSESEDFDLSPFGYRINETNIWGNIGGSARYSRQWNDKFFTQVELSSSEFFRNQTFSYDNTFDSLTFEFIDNELVIDTLTISDSFGFSYATKNEIEEAQIKVVSEYKINDNNVLDFGFYSIRNEVVDNIVYDGIEEENDEALSKLNGFYGQYTFQPNIRTKLTTGFRYSNYSLTNKWYFEPRIAINYKLNETFNLKASMGRYYQFVSNIKVIDPTGSRSSFWSLVDEDVPLLISNHYAGGITYQNNGITVDVEGYIKTVSGLSLFFTNQNSNDGSFNQLFTGNGRFYGAEFMVKRHFDKVDTWVSYTLARGEQRLEGINSNQYHPTNQDQRHELKWVVIWHLKKWTLSGSWIYGKGKPFTLDNSMVGDGGEAPDLTSINTSRLPDYHRLDVNVGYHTVIADKVKMDAGINFLNIYNRTNIRGYRVILFQDEFGNEQNLVKAINLLDFTPSLFINFSF